MTEGTMSISEAAKTLGLSRQLVHAWIKKGKLEADELAAGLERGHALAADAHERRQHHVGGHARAVILEGGKARARHTRPTLRNTLDRLERLQVETVIVVVSHDQVRLVGSTNQLHREGIHVALNGRAGDSARTTAISGSGELLGLPERPHTTDIPIFLANATAVPPAPLSSPASKALRSSEVSTCLTVAPALCEIWLVPALPRTIVNVSLETAVIKTISSLVVSGSSATVNWSTLPDASVTPPSKAASRTKGI